MYQITATAPTSYQLNSLKAFGMGYTPNGNGSYSARRAFATEDEAKDFLQERADLYNDEDPEGSESKLESMYEGIRNSGMLTLDAVTARIEELTD